MNMRPPRLSLTCTALLRGGALRLRTGEAGSAALAERDKIPRRCSPIEI